MNSPAPKPARILRNLGLILAVIFTVVCWSDRWVHSGFVTRELSTTEIVSVNREVESFVHRHEVHAPSIRGLKEKLELGPVRFSTYFGFSATTHSRTVAIHVALNENNPYIMLFSDKNNRNLQQECSPKGTKPNEYIENEEALGSALEFIKAQGTANLIDHLEAHRTAFSCFGSEEYYQFVWRERRDNDGIARRLLRIEVLVNPIDGGIYRYQHSKSEVENSEAHDPRVARDAVLASELCRNNCEVSEMTLFSYHDLDGGVRPAWEMNLESTEKNTRERPNLGNVIVDAFSGDVIKE